MALDERVERGQAGRRLDAVGALVAQRAHQLVDLADGLARDLLDRRERALRAPRGSRSALQPPEPGVDEDDVDRVAGRVVQVAGDPRALLGGGQAALRCLDALGASAPARSVRVAGQPGAAPDEPRRTRSRRREHDRPRRRRGDVGDQEHAGDRDRQPRRRARPVGLRGQK